MLSILLSYFCPMGLDIGIFSSDDGIPVLMVACDDNCGLMWSLVGALGDTLMTEGASLSCSCFLWAMCFRVKLIPIKFR